MPVQVLILDHNAQQYRDRLAPNLPGVVFHAATSPDDARTVAADVDVIVGIGHHIPNDLLAAAKSLKWVQALTTGTETLTAPGVLAPHVLLTSTRGVHGPQMSELVFLHMIALNRDFRKSQRSQAERKWDPWNQPILEGKTAVIVGLGFLAEHLAERCKLFGMRTVGVSGGRGKAPHFDAVYPREQIKEAAALADFLILLVPYSPQTDKLVSRDVLSAMKPTAFLINVARGGVLDEEALVDLLNAGKIAGAGLDVFSQRILPPDSPFWTMPNVIITPNVGGRSDRFVDQTLTVVEPNLRAFVEGRLKDLKNLVAH